MLYSHQFSGPALEILALADEAAHQVPPAFPLSATVAVNPFLGQAGEPLATTAARLARVAGVPVTQPRSVHAARIASGEITDADLADALASAPDGAPDGAPADVTALRAAASQPSRDTGAPLPTVADLAAEVSGIDWPAVIEDRLGLWAGGHFDRGQALWPAPEGGAYASWRAFAKRDLTPEIVGLRGFCARIGDSQMTANAALVEAAGALQLTPETAATAFHRALVTLGGWAQLARGLGWETELGGGRDRTLTDLLAVRLAWDAALFAQYSDQIGGAWARVRAAHAKPVAPTADQIIDATLQDAADRAAQRALARTFATTPAPTRDNRPAFQAAFCIDVRSEVFRRALEAADRSIETIGFAGFFGLAVSHKPLASDVAEARAPVLLSPGIESRTTADSTLDTATRLKRRAIRAWGRFKLAAVSSFAFVEATGPVHAVNLVRDSLGRPVAKPRDPAPTVDLALPERIGAGAAILRAMSLTEGFARVVLIAGHGADVVNTPHASALQCGACGGHAGDVNARILAALLNDAQVRDGLVDEGISIPGDTVFVPGLHDTVTDTVTLFTDGLPDTHARDLHRLSGLLDTAGGLARAERAVRLPGATGDSLTRRGVDWAQLRPEWALAGCRAFVAAPRTRSAGRDLGGQVFLHSYSWQQDEDFGTLELVLTAPVIVASWISLQYYGSSVAPEAFGGGNKLIHNVTGGIGVVEGNGGMLRTGLPWQSVHDGDALMHDPRRLAVVVEAPRAAISAVLDKHPGVRALFDNRWMSLHAMDDRGRMAWRYLGGDWIPEAAQAGQPASQTAMSAA